MKVHIVSNNNLIGDLETQGAYKISRSSDYTATEDADLVIISEDTLSFDDLISTRALKTINKSSHQQKIIYLYNKNSDADYLKHMQTLGRLHRVELMELPTDGKGLLTKVIDRYSIETQELSNVIAFFGADSKVGTTMIAHSVAELLAKHTELSVGLLCLNNNPSREYLKSSINTGIDNIKIKLFNNVLSADELVQVCVKESDALYILPGVDYSPDARLFLPEHIKRLIRMAAKKFDLVLIDAGSNIDSGLAIASLKLAKIKYLIITQQEAVRKNFKRIENQVFRDLGLDIKKFMLIVNKYIGSDFMHTSQQLSNLYGAILATVVPHADFFGWKAEVEEQTLLHYGLRSYNNQIDYLCKIIAMQNHIAYQEETREGIIRRTINSLGGM